MLATSTCKTSLQHKFSTKCYSVLLKLFCCKKKLHNGLINLHAAIYILSNYVSSTRVDYRSFFITNKTLGSQLGIINALNCNALWTAQTKEPFLPQYIYTLCRKYMKQPPEERKKFCPVKVVINLIFKLPST